MQRFAYLPVAAVILVSSAASAADMAVKAPTTPSSPWDIAITAAAMTDYNFRGVTQSAHRPSVQVGFEPLMHVAG